MVIAVPRLRRELCQFWNRDMNKHANVSVVINNYNYEKYVGAAIDSALSQDYEAVEVVVVDDGSTDGSREVIRTYGDRITAVYQANRGQGAAYNAGYAASHGDFVIFLDSDDRLHPNAVKEIVAHFEEDTSKVQYNLALIDQDGRSLQRPLFSTPLDAGAFLGLLEKFLYYPSPPGSGNAYSRRLLKSRLPLPEDLWKIQADSYLIFAAPLDGKIVHIDRCLGDYRRHGGGASDQAPERAFRDYVAKEYRKIIQARDYAAVVTGDSGGKRGLANPAFPPTHLKMMAAELFLCRPASATASGNLHFIIESIRSAAGWKPWPLSKRLLLPVWMMATCVLPRPAKRRFIVTSLAHSGY